MPNKMPIYCSFYLPSKIVALDASKPWSRAPKPMIKPEEGKQLSEYLLVGDVARHTLKLLYFQGLGKRKGGVY